MMAITSFGSAHGVLYALKIMKAKKWLVVLVSFVEAVFWGL